jgi:hypothetical protein
MARLFCCVLALALIANVSAQNCGLTNPAFCETFESGPAAVSDRGRGGELNRNRFSATRYFSSLSTGWDIPFWIRDAELGLMPGEPTTCRAGLPEFLVVTQDTLICEPSIYMGTRHLVTATGSQNYGVNSYRIRQPFDFANRTGRIAFDLDLTAAFLLGYSSVVISEDPTPNANWDLNGRGPNPRNGLLLVFNDANNLETFTRVSIFEIRDYATVASHTTLMDTPVRTRRGRLNHVEIRLSQQSVAVDFSEPSLDGIAFPALTSHANLTFAAPLTFSRGYVHMLSHNHATWKYTQQNYGTPHPLRSWNAYWDNIGFDGPIIDSTREYEVLDSNIASTINETYLDINNQTVTVQQPGHTIGYLIPNDPAVLSAPLVFRGVALANATRARLVMTGYYQNWSFNLIPQPTSRLIYQLNNQPKHERAFTSDEIAMYVNEAGQGGGMNHAIDLPLNELVEGDNTIRFSTRDLASGYPNGVLNLDLLIDFDLARVFANSFE